MGLGTAVQSRGYQFNLGKILIVLAAIGAGSGAPAEGLLGRLFELSMTGVVHRKVDNSYTEKLNLDPKVTVAVAGNGTLCTGTFVSSRVVLTAAHCVDASSATGNVNVDGVDSVAMVTETTPEGRAQRDVAFVLFPEGTAEFLGIKKFPSIAENAALPDDVVTLVGYGRSHWDKEAVNDAALGAGIRGWNQAKLALSMDGALVTIPFVVAPNEFTEPTNDVDNRSVALQGDSGGAVYNTKGEIVGIVSKVAEFEKKVRGTGLFSQFFVVKSEPVAFQNIYVDVTENKASDLLASVETCEMLENCFHATKLEVSSELPEAPKLDTDPFAHVTLRTGFFTSKVKEAEERAFIRPAYWNKKLVSVDASILDGANEKAIYHFTMVSDDVGIDTEKMKLALVHKSFVVINDLVKNESFDPTKDDPSQMFHPKLMGIYSAE